MRAIFSDEVRRAKMKDKRLSLTALSALLVALLVWVAPSWAQQGVDQRIKALEDELTRLKAEQEQVKTEQMALRKDALAAEAALPKFEYRAGDGLTISAADESWQFNISLRLNIHMYNFVDPHYLFAFGGQQRAGNTDPLALFPRRLRLYMNYCWEDCFWEIQTSFDGETSVRETNWRDNEILMHFEKWNPYFPYASFGLRRGAGRTYEGRSSTNDGKLEHPIILEGFNWGGDGSHAGAGIGWDRVPVGLGDFQLFLNWASERQGTYQEYVHTARSGMMGFAGTRPFSKQKDGWWKWLSGLDVGFGWQFQSIDNPNGLTEDDSGAVNIRVRNEERRGRQDWFRPGSIDNSFGDDTGQNVGGGFAYVLIPGMQWRIGPYQARFNYIYTRYRDNSSQGNPGYGGVWAKGVDIGHQVFVWSPKGFFTGSPSTPGSLMLSYNYEHGIMSCGRIGNTDHGSGDGGGHCENATGSGEFHNQSYVLNQTSLWYWIRPALRVGVWWNYWGFANTPGQSGIAVGCWSGNKAFTRSGANANQRVGNSCWWNSVNLGWQLTW